MQYKIVSGITHTELEEKVNKLLTEGWALHGSLVAKTNGLMFQAMTVDAWSGRWKVEGTKKD